MEFALTARQHISVVKHRAFELLVLPSERVFVVPLESKAAQLSGLQLGYELESHLLIDAESMVSHVHTCTLGAIALVADGSEVADAFTVAELHSTIALTARTGLVIQGFFNRLVPGSRAEGTICFVVADSPQAEIADVVLVHQQRIVNWRYCASENARSVCNELIEMAQLGDVVKIVWIGITPANLSNPASASESIRASQAVSRGLERRIHNEFRCRDHR